MRRYAGWSLTLLGLAVFLLFTGGCGSSKPSRFYTLNPMVPASSSGSVRNTPLSGSCPTIGIVLVEIPDYLDRPQIVTRNADNGLKIAEFDRWGGELQKDIARVLAETMSTSLTGNSIFIQTGRRAIPADYRITVHVTRFEGIPGNAIWLKAMWTILEKDGRHVVVRGELDHREPVPGSDYEATVAAMSRAVDRLGKEIAGAVKPMLTRDVGTQQAGASRQ
ncbi:MAG: hypothetical protein A4E57_02816 [Syntrophorhabdaceae bacterium PtaU1.Bin034]|jgi:uncharacterized lipoprotein YmbA|nr:MAG: hypothetical protein A4E57_02816 [Syntrophorhabdaceae bacterium PtaU1.Bin034]